MTVSHEVVAYETQVNDAARSGGRILVDQLIALGITTLFGVPGESYLPVLDALSELRQEIRFITARHEGAAAFMASADGKLTGLPGVCLVSRGPGALHAANGVHMAMQNSTPMILLVGQIASTVREREAFQEIDVRGVFGSLSKWAADIPDADRIPEFVSRAVQVATSGRPGPVVLGLPEDLLRTTTMSPVIPCFERGVVTPNAETIQRIRELLSSAQRPIFLVGGAGWTKEAKSRFERFAIDNQVAVASVFRYQDVFDNEIRTYIGDVGLGVNPFLAARLKQADLVVAIGPRLDDATTDSYHRLEAPLPKQSLIHVHQGSEEIGRVYRPTLGVVASVPDFVNSLAGIEPLATPAWTSWTDECRQQYLQWRTPMTPAREEFVDLGAAMSQLRGMLPDDAIIANGAGNYTTWIHRYFSFRQYGTQLALVGGSMGYGLPAAIAAKCRHPERSVVALAGDGCFLMSSEELATASQEGVPVVILVVNNEMYGTIRLHQERRYPGRAFATDIESPDFVALARSYGAYAELVDRTDDFIPAFERASAQRRPALLELRVDPLQLTPSVRLPV